MVGKKARQFLINSHLTREEAASLINFAIQRNEALCGVVNADVVEVASIRQLVRYDAVATQGQAQFLVMLKGSRSNGPLRKLDVA